MRRAIPWLLCLAACSGPAEPKAHEPPPAAEPSAKAAAAAAPAPPTKPTVPYDVPLRDESRLRSDLLAGCAEAVASRRPLLLEWTAPWCKDCVKLHELKQQEPLSSEVARWNPVVINVGRFDRHRPLLQRWNIKAIANWTVLRPTDCEAPVLQWPVQAQRTLEPVTGEQEGVDPAELAAWLRAQRG